MTKRFAELTAFIPRIKDGNFGEWVIDRENDGTPEHPIQFPYVKYSSKVDDFVQTLYAFCEAHPEFEHTRYDETLERLGREWGSKFMEEADVSGIDAKGVLRQNGNLVAASLVCMVKANGYDTFSGNLYGE